jgi:hypothetical protein
MRRRRNAVPLRNRILTFLAAATITGFLTIGSADAHPRARAHRHGKATAVIVVGTKSKPRVATIDGARHGILDFNVKPKISEVWVNGTYRGTCDTFDGFPGKLTLAPGFHTIRLVMPDGIEVARDLRVRAGVEINVALDLR